MSFIRFSVSTAVSNTYVTFTLQGDVSTREEDLCHIYSETLERLVKNYIYLGYGRSIKTKRDT